MPVEYIATKLFYCAFMIMFVGSFMDVAKFSTKRVIKYIAFGLVYIPTLLYIPDYDDYRAMLMFTLVIFFVFDGTILERITMNTIAESVWCALSLLSKIIFQETLTIVVPSEASQKILLDLICLVTLSCVIRLANQASVFEQEIVKKRVSSVKQLFGMLVLAVEGDLVLLIAEFIFMTSVKLKIGPYVIGPSVIAFVLCLAGLYLVCFALSLDNTMAKEYYKVTNRTLETQIKSQYAYYQKLEKVTRETRAIKHDMKNHLIVMKGMTEKKDLDGISKYLDNIQSTMDNVSVVIHTGNSIVDSIVNEKNEIAVSKGIDMKVNVSLPEEINVIPMDLCVMVANSLDNAIEACEKIETGNKREISLYGRCERGYLSFIISNSVKKGVRIIQNAIITDKEDKLNHGYGLRNIKSSVKRNGGKINIECEDGTFSLYIDIPLT